MSEQSNVENPERSANPEEGNDVDIEPVGSELLELGEVLEWEKETKKE